MPCADVSGAGRRSFWYQAQTFLVPGADVSGIGRSRFWCRAQTFLVYQAQTFLVLGADVSGAESRFSLEALQSVQLFNFTIM